jgi:hypothetical protein
LIKARHYRWRKHGSPLNSLQYDANVNKSESRHEIDSHFLTFLFQGKFLIENVSEGVIVGNQTLALQKVTREDAGLYTCVASNNEGDGESNAQYLDIKCN